MKNLPLLLATIIGSLVLIVGVAVLFSRQTSVATQVVDPAKLLGSRQISKGPETAKVTIVEFSDFECPACRAAQPLIAQALAQNPNDVRVVYKHFPLSGIHPYAQLAAQASEVALRNNKFWEFHDILFARQDEWAGLGSQEEVKNKFADYAQEIGIDKSAFLSTIDAEDIRNLVLGDVTLGGELGINSTPTFYVNGQRTAPGGLIEKVSELLQAS